jgi:hypothetical protein
MLIIAVGVGSFLSFLIFEPATTRAAFRRTRSKTGRPSGPRKTGTPKARQGSKTGRSKTRKNPKK